MFKRITAILLLSAVLTTFIGCSEKLKSSDESTSQAAQVFDASQLQPPAKGETIAIMKTTMGDIKIKFFEKEAPKAVENFIGLAKKGYYNNLIFHRVINNFMIQGGDPTGTGSGGESLWGKAFEDEFSKKLHNFRGALSMANAGKNTNGSQFFIVQSKSVDDVPVSTMKEYGFEDELIKQYQKLGGTPWLDGAHTVFGQVYEGMDVVDKIAAVEVNSDAKPLEDVKIVEVSISTQE